MKRRIGLVVLAVAGVVLSVAQTPVLPQEPVVTAEIEGLAMTFETLVVAWAEAMQSGDIEAGRSFYADDVVHHDESLMVHKAGIDDVARLAGSGMCSPQREVMDCFIGLSDGVAVLEYWDCTFGRYTYTREDPWIVVHHFEMDDALIAYWTLFYGVDTMEKSVCFPYTNFKCVSANRREEIRSLLSSYALAWSSGSPETVADLYAVDALRDDAILGEFRQGRPAIVDFAESFFARYPEARWDLLVGFGEGDENAAWYWSVNPGQVTGGVFTIEVMDTEGQPCEVRAAVLLKVSEGRIIHESWYYDADSVIRCGWAQ